MSWGETKPAIAQGLVVTRSASLLAKPIVLAETRAMPIERSATVTDLMTKKASASKSLPLLICYFVIFSRFPSTPPPRLPQGTLSPPIWVF